MRSGIGVCRTPLRQVGGRDEDVLVGFSNRIRYFFRCCAAAAECSEGLADAIRSPFGCYGDGAICIKLLRMGNGVVCSVKSIHYWHCRFIGIAGNRSRAWIAMDIARMNLPAGAGIFLFRYELLKISPSFRLTGYMRI
jgi:hypothetical protein